MRRSLLLLALLAAAPEADPLPPTPPGLPVGRSLPSLTLTDDAGAPFALQGLARGPAWLVFFRGASCPSCRAQLAALARLAPRIRRAGVRLVAVSPDPPARLAALRAELGLAGFVLLSDEEEQAVGALCGGLAHCQLLVAPGGTIRWAGWTDGWARPPRPEALLLAAGR